MFDFRESITLSVFGALSSLVFWAESPAQAATFQLSWTGQILGYQIITLRPKVLCCKRFKMIPSDLKEIYFEIAPLFLSL
jgi:hypothetical protein